jgi:hypothetical protein
MRNKLGVIAMLGAMMSAGTESNFKRGGLYEPEQQPIKPPPPKGTRFVIMGVEIYALNERNARRKYNNLMNKR